MTDTHNTTHIISTTYSEDDEAALISGEYGSPETAEFFEPVLDSFAAPGTIAPQVLPCLVETLQQQHLLVLNGSEMLNRPALSRHVAWSLRTTLQQQAQSSKPFHIPVLEWYPGTAPRNPIIALQHHTHPSIFILPRLMPHHIGYNLPRLHEAAATRNHYVIAQTDVPMSRWQLPEEAHDYWHDMTSLTYRSNDLADVLIQRLTATYQHRALVGTPGTLSRDDVLVGSETIRSVAARLRTPRHIDMLVTLLAREPHLPNEDALLALITLVRDNRRILEHWYLQVLTPREQLFALGLSLFEGMFDDQIFAAIEAVVEQAWQHRDASLRALDYCDLEGLRHCFNFVKTRDARLKIESIVPQQRRLLLEIAWEHYRRQILAALPVLEHLVTNATRESTTTLRWDLYGTPARCDQVCRVVGETLGDIGLISTVAVQDTLLRLIAHERPAAQAVAARTMARWYGDGRARELAAMFQRWQREQRVIALISGVVKERQKEQIARETAQSYIRATIALMVGYAAQYDAPGTLSSELGTRTGRLSEDRHPLVRSRFRDETLALVVPLHAVQLRHVLRDMTAHIDMHPSLAHSLACAYWNTPAALLAVLEEWYDECVRHRPRRTNRRVITLRETLLATVVRTYGEIRYDQRSGSDTINAAEAFRRIQRVLAHERHPFVRGIVFVALHRLTRHHFGTIEQQVQHFIPTISERERDRVVTILTHLYLEQRTQQPGGDDTIEVDGATYPVWIYAPRPLTEVEQVVFRWLKDDGQSEAQEVALAASVAFVRVLEKAERRRINQLRRQYQRDAAEAESEAAEAAEAAQSEIPDAGVLVPSAIAGASLPSAYVEEFVPWFVTIDAKQYRPVIRGLLTEALEQSTASRDAMVFVLNKWHRTSDDDLHNIANRLERALSLIEGGFVPLLIVGGLVLFALFLLVRLILSLVF